MLIRHLCLPHSIVPETRPDYLPLPMAVQLSLMALLVLLQGLHEVR